MLTNKQSKEIELIKWFVPQMFSRVEITDGDIQKFFENSEQGKHKDEIRKRMLETADKADGFIALMHGKLRREVNIAMYIKDFQEYRQALAEVWCRSQDFPEFVAQEIIKKL